MLLPNGYLDSLEHCELPGGLWENASWETQHTIQQLHHQASAVLKSGAQLKGGSEEEPHSRKPSKKSSLKAKWKIGSVGRSKSFHTKVRRH